MRDLEGLTKQFNYIMKIITIPEKVLLQKAKPVKVFDTKLRKIVNDMKVALNACTDPIGVGLAAPQVGLPLRIFLIKPTAKSEIQVFINPEVVSVDNTRPAKNKQEADDEPLEGCLSIPKIWGPVERAYKITLSWSDVKGKRYTKVFEGFEAVIIQHEYDHLDGVLFTHRSAEQKAILYEEKGKKLYEMTL